MYKESSLFSITHISSNSTNISQINSTFSVTEKISNSTTLLRKPLVMAIASLVSFATLSSAQTVYAQEAVLEEIVVTGSRGKPRTVADSPVPIDVFTSEAIEEVSYTDTNDVLKTLVPSYSISREPISDGSTFIRPASLRGMPTDKTLVLVNSKRRHRAALVTIGGSGTQGPDIATIPTAALKSVEVLRDGAAALYGSDAIAGVINFILKDESEGVSFSVDTGEYSEGDGFQTTMQGNLGLPIGDTGFVNMSLEWSEADATVRAEQYCESWFCLDPSNPVYDAGASYTAYTNDPAFMAAAESSANIGDGDVVQPWGQPNTDATRFFVNMGYTLSDEMDLYGFANYSSSSADGGFFYRYPGNGTIEDLREADGSIYSPLEKFPGGFTPRFFGDVTDYALVAGLRGMFTDSLSYDFSARTAENKIEYTLMNTINPSMGAASPTSFKPGDLINEEMQIQADFNYELSTDAFGPVNIAFGLSYMDESYDVVAGEEDSYEAGPHAVSDPFGFCDAGAPTAAGVAVIGNGSTLDCADPDDPVFTVVGVGSNGFPGYSPAFSDTYTRNSFGAYSEISIDLTEDLFLQGALRYEDYSDFGSEVVGKIAAKYNLTETVGLRGSLGTGFRAPTPGQQGTVNVSTRLPNGFPVATGLFPASGPVAQALGAEPLDPELSTNYTFGLTTTLGSVDLTVDFYRIDVQDRTYAVSTRDVSTDPGAGEAYDNYQALVNANVAGAETIGGVFYFANAFDTVTEGVDVVATYPLEWGNDSVTTLTASMNFNTTEFDSDPSEFLNAEDQFDFENGEPQFHSVLTARHAQDNFTVMLRGNYYGAYENSNTGGTPLRIQKFDPIIMFDLEGSYQFNEALSLALGGRNIFDKYPEKDSISDYCCGRLYSSATVVSWQGAYYYARLNVDF